MIKDKQEGEIEHLIKRMTGVTLPKLDIGCGSNKQDGFIGMDNRQCSGVDIVHDIEVVPYPIKEKSFSVILASHVVEHLKPWLMIDIMNEWWRLLEDGGQLWLAMPYAGSFGFYQDPTHIKCYSDDTEVLTITGWKLIKDVVMDEEVLTMNPNNLKTEFQRTKAIVNEPYNGDMFHFKTKRMDLLVTPNHKMLMSSSGKSRKWSIRDASTFRNISRKSRVGLGVIPDWVGKNDEFISIPQVERGGNNAGVHLPVRFLTKDFMEFLGWFVSEGCVNIYDKNHSNRIVIYQSQSVHKNNYEGIYSLIKRMGFNPQRRKDRIDFQSKDLVEYLKQFGKDCYTKTIPDSIKSYSKELLQILLSAAIKGDGRKQKSGSEEYASVSYRLASDIQEIALKCGYRSTLYKEDRAGECVILGKVNKCVGIYLVSLCKPSSVFYSTPKIIKYEGRMVCLGVPEHHLIFVRRNGRCIWSGNTWNEATPLYYDPKEFLYEIYKPLPWKIVKNVWTDGGNLEVVFEKINKDIGDQIYSLSKQARKENGVTYGKE